MNAQGPRTLNLFSLFAFKDAYWMMNEHAKASFHQHWLAGLGGLYLVVRVLRSAHKAPVVPGASSSVLPPSDDPYVKRLEEELKIVRL